MSGNPGGGGKSGIWILLGVIALSIVAGGVYLTVKPPPAPPGRDRNTLPSKAGTDSDKPLSPADCAQLASIRNLGIAHLEDGRLDQAEAEFQEMVEKAPRAPIGLRNLAVCQLLIIESPPQGEAAPSPQKALEVIDRLKLVEPKSAVPWVLAARVERKGERHLQAAENYQKAIELAPDDPTIQYELYLLARDSSDETVHALTTRTIESLIKLDPNNSFLLTESLLKAAEAKDERILKILDALEQQIRPIFEQVLQQTRVNIDEVSAQIRTAVQQGQWPQAFGRSRTLTNVIRPQEWVKSDLRRLERHSLVYMLSDLGDAGCGPFEEPSAESAPLRFQRLEAERQIPALAGVVDLNLADFDLDRRADVITLTPDQIRVFSRGKEGDSWQPGTTAAVRSPMAGLIVADFDRDVPKGGKGVQPQSAGARSAPASAPPVASGDCQVADLEVITFGPAGIQVFRNELDPSNASRSLVEVEQDEAFSGIRNVVTGVMADVDHDGDLDLVLSTDKGISIWANQGKLRFAEITGRSSLSKGELPATSIVAVDWDRDLDVDLIVTSNGNAPAGWLENLRHGAFRWRSFEGDLAQLTRSASLNVAELDGNVSWDLIGVGDQGVRVIRTVTAVPGAVSALDSLAAATEGGVFSLTGDFDNDSHADLISWNDSGVHLYQGAPPNRFSAVENALDGLPASVVVLRSLDLDEDGRLDLVVAGPEDVAILRNVSEDRNHWLSVRAVGKDEDKQGDVNHLGIGSLLEVRAGSRYQAQVISGPVTHFGLGAIDAPEVLRAVWTNGVPQPVAKPKTDAVLCREHDPKGSCPYIYTWNGEAYEFCTDGCWGAPLGLQHAEGIYAKPRAWEYLTIPGDKLKPRNGRYSLQFTEELWEATYLDHMTLIAIDHPADTEIYSNEKVGPAEISEFKIHTVREKRFPVAARDKHGVDVLPRLLREDRRFMKGFDSESRRGLVEEHYLELDLGKLEPPKQLTLFLTGWMYPTSTSLNLGVSSGKDGPEIRPPALWIPDADGTWREVRSFMGFPGGKTKTIAVDLSGVLPMNDSRLRIVTNMEFYWDAAFFTVDEEPVPLKSVELPVAHADLHYRGFSQIVRMPDFGPDHYDYAHVHNDPKWPPMGGSFTRFGNVTELLSSQDDLQVVIGAGDEITIEFDVPSDEPPTGWKRDFLLHNVGWDKDADLNVVYGQAVEPLPFHGMTGYPDGIENGFPQSARHETYLRTWQTRTQAPARFWRHVRNRVSARSPEE